MARLLEFEVDNVAELRARLEERAFPEPYAVAVEALIFDSAGRWILMRRGRAAKDEVGKLEGVGGRVEGDGPLRDELAREILEEVGEDARVRIVDFLEVKSDRVQKRDEAGAHYWKDWVIASYICRLDGGQLIISEPEKNDGFEYITDLNVDPARLSSSCQQSLNSLQEDWVRIRKSIESF